MNGPPSFIFIVIILSVAVSIPTATAAGPSRELKAKVALLKAGDWEIRRTAVEDIAELGGQAAGDILLAVLQDPFEEDEVREAAAAGLGKMKDTRAVRPLIQVLKVRRASLVMSAALALAKLGDDRAAEPLAATVAFRVIGRDHKVIEALLSFKDKAVGPLLEMLKIGSGEKRKWAMAALGRTASPRAVEPVAAILKDPDPSLRALAAGTLAKLEDGRAVPALAAALVAALADKDARTGIACAEALAELPGNEAVAPLIAALKDDSAELRAKAAQALGGHDRKAVVPLARALKDADSSVRRSAARALGAVGDRTLNYPSTYQCNMSAEQDWVKRP